MRRPEQYCIVAATPASMVRYLARSQLQRDSGRSQAYHTARILSTSETIVSQSFLLCTRNSVLQMLWAAAAMLTKDWPQHPCLNADFRLACQV